MCCTQAVNMTRSIRFENHWFKVLPVTCFYSSAQLVVSTLFQFKGKKQKLPLASSVDVDGLKMPSEFKVVITRYIYMHSLIRNCPSIHGREKIDLLA